MLRLADVDKIWTLDNPRADEMRLIDQSAAVQTFIDLRRPVGGND